MSATTIPTPNAALHRLQSAIEEAALSLEAERQRLELLTKDGPAYDQGCTDAIQRILRLIAIRMDQLPVNAAAQTELRNLREAIIEAL